MALLHKPTSAAKIAVLYITLGAIGMVWSGIWLWYLRGHPPARDSTWFWAIGFLATGAVVLIIGLALGRIGRSAREAELPPKEAIVPEAAIQQAAAANPPPALAVQPPAAPLATPVSPVPHARV